MNSGWRFKISEHVTASVRVSNLCLLKFLVREVTFSVTYHITQRSFLKALTPNFPGKQPNKSFLEPQNLTVTIKSFWFSALMLTADTTTVAPVMSFVCDSTYCLTEWLNTKTPKKKTNDKPNVDDRFYFILVSTYPTTQLQTAICENRNRLHLFGTFWRVRDHKFIWWIKRRMN